MAAPQVVLDHHSGGQRATDRDPRNRQYGIRRLVGTSVVERDLMNTSKFWPRGLGELYQGGWGHCGGFAAGGDAAASPIRVRDVDNAWCHAFYYEIKDRRWDPWGREDGTSTQAVMRLIVARGLAEAYAWGFDLPDLRTQLEVGPVLCGTTWTTGMFTPDRDGIIHPTGGDEGGHLWLASGYYRNFRGASGRTYGRCLRIDNWWSHGWGLRGRAVMPADEAAHVIFGLNGEAGVPVHRHLPSPGSS